MFSLALLAAALPALPPCRPAQLRLSLDGRDGDFNGMSHAGVEIVLSNRGTACTLPALPVVDFRDSRGHILPAQRRAPPGMHPGPVMVPLTLGPGERVTADLRWVSGAVYDRSRSIRAVRVAVRIGGGSVVAPLTVTLYGPSGGPVPFDQTPLRAGS